MIYVFFLPPSDNSIGLRETFNKNLTPPNGVNGINAPYAPGTAPTILFRLATAETQSILTQESCADYGEDSISVKALEGTFLSL